MPVLNLNPDPATRRQVEYINQLSIDLCFSIRARDAHIKDIVKRETKPDGLSKAEASLVINKFKEWKES